MSASEQDLAKGDYVASNHHNLDDPELLAIFPNVIDRIQLQNVMEQEELLLYYGSLGRYVALGVLFFKRSKSLSGKRSFQIINLKGVEFSAKHNMNRKIYNFRRNWILE